jgi:S-adenosylmethionine decarboxylase
MVPSSPRAFLDMPHVLVDLSGCDRARLDDLAGLKRLLHEAARDLGCTTIGDIFHHFSPHGVTGVLAVAESHLSVHTWVDEGYAAIDLFLCNARITRAEIDAVVARMAAFLRAARTESRVERRRASACLPAPASDRMPAPVATA